VWLCVVMQLKPSLALDDTDVPRLLSVRELAARTSTSQNFWRAQIAQRRLPVTYCGRALRIRVADALAFLETRARPAERRDA